MSNPRFGTANFERRKHPRFSVDVPVEYHRMQNNSKCHSARTVDISEGGLLLYVSEEIKIGQNLRVKVFLESGGILESIEAQVQVAWKDVRLEKEGFYRIGVRIIEISLQDLDRLRGFLNHLIDDRTLNVNVPSKLLSNLGISKIGDFACLVPKNSDPG